LKVTEPCTNKYFKYKNIFESYEIYVDKEVIVGRDFGASEYSLQP